MPNQPANHKQSVTISIPKELVAQLDMIAAKDDRSRTKVMELLLREQVRLYNEAHAADPKTRDAHAQLEKDIIAASGSTSPSLQYQA